MTNNINIDIDVTAVTKELTDNYITPRGINGLWNSSGISRNHAKLVTTERWCHNGATTCHSRFPGWLAELLNMFRSHDPDCQPTEFELAVIKVKSAFTLNGVCVLWNKAGLGKPAEPDTIRRWYYPSATKNKEFEPWLIRLANNLWE